MRKLFSVLMLVLFASVPVFAIDPGQAQGTITVGVDKIPLAFAYAIGHQKNEFSNRKDDVRVVITNKPLDSTVDLANIDYSFPDGVYGVVVCLDRSHVPSHIAIQHQTGMYDAGYFGPGDDYVFTGVVDRDHVEGTFTSKTITTSTTKFNFDVAVNAAVKR